MAINTTNYVAQLKQKNRRALEFIMDEYGNLVYSVVRKVLPDGCGETYIEECLNDVFLAVWNNSAGFEESKGDFKCWLAAVAKYKAVDCRRRLCRQDSVEYLADREAYSELTTENIVVAKENRDELLAAIHDLNEQDREIFIRRYFLAEDIEYIARMFRVERNVIDQRLSRGRKFLKEKLVWKGEML